MKHNNKLYSFYVGCNLQFETILQLVVPRQKDLDYGYWELKIDSWINNNWMACGWA